MEKMAGGVEVKDPLKQGLKLIKITGSFDNFSIC